MDKPVTYSCGRGGTLQIYEYGNVVKMVFTVIKRDGHIYRADTMPISVNELTLVRVILNSNAETPDVSVYVRIKREKDAKYVVPLTVHCEDFNKEFFCSDDWIETEIKRKTPDSRTECDCGTIRLFNFEVKFTVHAVSDTSLVSTRLYEDTEFTDFQLQTADGGVAVHKNVLCIHSERIKEMLREEWKGKTEGQFNVYGVTVQTLQNLKDYMYLGSLPHGSQELEPLLIIAARYAMDKLKAACIRKLVELIVPGQLDGLINFACQYNVPELVSALVFDVPDNQKFADCLAKNWTKMTDDGCEECLYPNTLDSD